MLEEGQRNDWFQSGFIVRLGIVAAVGLALFVWRELTTDRPAVNLRILSNISFASATALGGVLGLALTASLFLLPVFLQNLLGFNAMHRDSRLCLAVWRWRCSCRSRGASTIALGLAS